MPRLSSPPSEDFDGGTISGDLLIQKSSPKISLRQTTDDENRTLEFLNTAGGNDGSIRASTVPDIRLNDGAGDSMVWTQSQISSFARSFAIRNGAGSTYGLFVKEPGTGIGVGIGTASPEASVALHTVGKGYFTDTVGIGILPGTPIFQASHATASSLSELKIGHTDNTSATSHAQFTAQVGGTSGGDPKNVWGILSGQAWYAGLDNSDSDKFIIGRGTAVGTTPSLTFDTSDNAEFTAKVGVGLTAVAALDATSSGTGTTTFRAVSSATTVPSFILDSGSAIHTGGQIMQLTNSNSSSTSDTLRITTQSSGASIKVNTNNNARGLHIVSGSNTTSALMEVNNTATQTAGDMVYLVQDSATSAAQALTVRNDGTGNGLRVDQDGQGKALRIDSESLAGPALEVDTIQTSGNVVSISNTGTMSGGNILSVNSTSGNATVMAFTNSGTGLGVRIDQDGDNSALCVDSDAASATAVDINHATNDAGETYAMTVISDNAGAGTPGGIDFSSMSADEPLVKAPADAITTAGTVSQQIPINIGGTIYYLVAYTHGS